MELTRSLAIMVVFALLASLFYAYFLVRVVCVAYFVSRLQYEETRKTRDAIDRAHDIIDRGMDHQS